MHRAHLRACAALASAAFAAALATSVPARADDAEAQRHFEAGRAAYTAGRFADAEAEYQRAWDLRHTFDVAANLGDCEVEIGQFREAAEHLAYALRELPISAKENVKARVRERFVLAKAQVAAIRVKVTPAHATVKVNGREAPAPLPEEIFADPGPVQVEASMAGYAPGAASIVGTRGGTHDVALTLLPGGAGDGAPSKKSLPIILVGGGVTVAALVTGVILRVVSSGKGTDADDLRGRITAQNPGNPSPCAAGAAASGCSDLATFNGDADTFANASTGMFIGAGVVGAATLAYALWPTGRTTPAATGVRFTPVVSPSFAGGTLRVRF